MKNPKKKSKEQIILTNEEDYKDYLNVDLINKKFDKIGKYKITHLVTTISGLFLVSLSIYLTNYSSKRTIDNTTYGEFNVTIVILLFIGVIITIFSIIKLFDLKNPIDNFINSIENIENNEINAHEKEESNEAPLNDNTFSIKNFNTIIRKKLRKPSSKKTQTTLDSVIPNSKKLHPKEEEEKNTKKLN